MGKIRDGIRRAIPWIDPVIEYFDWKKSVTAAATAIVIGGWSFVKDLPWPVIITLVLSMLVQALYLLYFPAFLKVVHSGVKVRPNHNIWKHKRQFRLFEAACLLADAEPIDKRSQMDGDSRAWYSCLCEAVVLREIQRIPSRLDAGHDHGDGSCTPFEYTVIAAESLKQFSDARKLNPWFLMDDH
jgi:hypothetical protein